MVYKTNQICFSRFWNPDQTVWSDRVNWKPPIKEVLLTLITDYYKKFCEPWEPPFNLPGLTVLTAQTVWVFFFFWLLTAIIVEASSLQLQPPTVRLSELRLHAIFVLLLCLDRSLSLSLFVFADAVYLHFCLWSLLLLQFFVDDVLPCFTLNH